LQGWKTGSEAIEEEVEESEGCKGGVNWPEELESLPDTEEEVEDAVDDYRVLVSEVNPTGPEAVAWAEGKALAFEVVAQDGVPGPGWEAGLVPQAFDLEVETREPKIPGIEELGAEAHILLTELLGAE